MIKKYTFLLLIGIFLLVGIKSAHAMPVAVGGNPDFLIENQADSIFLRGEDRLTIRNSKQTGSVSDNFSLEEQTVWSSNGLIYIRSAEVVDVQVYTITGQLTKQLKVTGGEMVIPVPKGLYIVRLGNVVRKVVVR